MKAILIDGASLQFIVRDLNLRGGGISYPGLYDVVTKGVGTPALDALRPGMTMHPRWAEKLGKVLRLAGYDVIPTTSEGSKDDRIIQDRIIHLPDNVEEIIIISRDSDFVPHLRLRRKAGVRIIWAGTRAKKVGDQQSYIGEVVERYIAQGEFEFVELNQYRKQLTQQRPKPLQGPGSRIIIEADDVDILPEFVSEIAEVLNRYKDRIRFYPEGPVFGPNAIPMTDGANPPSPLETPETVEPNIEAGLRAPQLGRRRTLGR